MTKIPAKVRSIQLPKWPQMCVWGPDVPVELAYQIIARTDRFLVDIYGSSNQRKFLARFQKETGFSKVRVLARTMALGADWSGWLRDVKQELEARLGHIPLAYVRMEQVDTSYIYGPNGFVSPEGQVFFAENIGKWPDVESVLEDWQRIARAFPELSLTATLMSEEHCDADKSKPLVSFRVENGHAAVLVNPVPPDATWRTRFVALCAKRQSPDFFMDKFGPLNDDAKPQGCLPEHWVTAMTAHIRSVMLPLLKEKPFLLKSSKKAAK